MNVSYIYYEYGKTSIMVEFGKQSFVREFANKLITSVSWKTLTVVAILLIDADAAVTTGITGALVDVDGTLGACPSWLTGAIITAGLFEARRNKQSKRPHTDIFDETRLINRLGVHAKRFAND